MSVVLKTSLGDIELELFTESAPETVANFLGYVRDGFYKGTIFHRVIDNFMIQGGGMTPDMANKAGKTPVRNEADNRISNERGTIAMARTSAPHSATSQFFINVKDNSFLDFRAPTPSGYGYCVFGKVISGMDVVDQIKSVETTSRPPYDDVPETDIVILDAVEK